MGFSPCPLFSSPNNRSNMDIPQPRPPSLHRILGNVFSIPCNALRAVRPNLREPCLPHLARISEILLDAIGKSSLNELHGLFDRHRAWNRDEHMQVIRHHHEIEELKLPRRHIGAQNLDQKCGISIGLQQAAPSVCLGGREKSARCAQNLVWSGVAIWSCHNLG